MAADGQNSNFDLDTWGAHMRNLSTHMQTYKFCSDTFPGLDLLKKTWKKLFTRSPIQYYQRTNLQYAQKL